MKRIIFIVLLFLSIHLYGEEKYIVIGWNDLGMHCSNKDFSNIAILPPYNTLVAHVLQVGDDNSFPKRVTGDFRITYEIPGNTYSVGKTNFWSYEDKLFGVELQDNIGLTGKGLTGEMDAHDDYFEAVGIPTTPYTDADLNNEAPYQLATLKLFDNQNNLLDTTRVVIPVSNEIGCVSSGCHPSEDHIINEHEDEDGFDRNKRPILCAECHASNALGKPGRAGLESLSYVIHRKHRDKTNDCYKCHPGYNTKCLRGAMFAKGMTCQSCHGTMSEFAQSLKDGREPWLEEPQCGSSACHGPNYAENDNSLFRLSRGHGNLYCSTCHGSPHAILASTEPNDNVQNIELQGTAGTLASCTVCHGIMPGGAGPHNITVPVEFTAFSASVSNNIVNLQWTCEYLLDLYHFEIQRSYNENQFETIATISADNARQQSYAYQDNGPFSEQLLFYRLKIINSDGSIEFSSVYKLFLELPTTVTLYDGYPNPFNNHARIRFELPALMNVNVRILNMQGQVVRDLADEQMTAGLHELSWNALSNAGRTVPSGLYFITLETRDFNQMKKISLIK